MSTIGFLGVGAMGGAIARSMLGAGHELVVWNRSADRVDDLVALGATRAETPGEALRVPLSFSMLANDAAAESVLTAENVRGVAGSVHCCMSSLSPAATDRLAAVFDDAAAGYVAAPVLGRPEVALRGALNILAAGHPAAIDAATPALEAASTRIWRVGDEPRRASVVKVAVNYNIIHALQALAESITLIERHGNSGAEFVDLLASTLFDGVVYRGYGRIIAEQSYLPAGFTLELGRKDLGLAVQAAAEVGLDLPSAPKLIDLFDEALRDETLRAADWASVAEITRRQAH